MMMISSGIRFYSSVVAKLQRESAAREGVWTRVRDDETGRERNEALSCVKPVAAAARSS